jgi:P-type Ca2+ transporter type 2C
VRRLDALETLGSVTVICSDKTGTITENRMRVVETWVPTKGKSDEQQREDEALLILIAASCNRARLPDLGDPTEIGLLKYAEEKNIDPIPFDEEEVPFTSEEKYMRTRHGDRSFLKGAPEKIIDLTHEPDREEIMKAHDDMATEGLRVLAMAVMENGKVRFVGLMGMEDPPRPEVVNALKEAHEAGIRTIMITGDNLQTALAIARKIGIGSTGVDGATIESWSPAKMREMVKTVAVYARVSPVHKLKILEALEHNHQIVAMTGDGVNDAPALKTAHVGVAMGRDGTQVAREASSLVLTDDNYATIVSAIREGRRIYDNIRKFVFFLVQTNLGQLMLITLCVALGLPLPLLPLHILWINLMTDGLPALALGMEREEPGIMKRPPRSPKENIFTGEWLYLLFIATFACGATFLVFLWALNRFDDIQQVRAITFTFSIFLEIMLAFVSRSRSPLWRIGFFSNPWLIGACIIPIILQLAIFLSPVRAIFEVSALSMNHWWMLAGIVVGGFVVLELLKTMMKRSH